MNENFLENLPSDDKKRLAYIEKRPDLFETKVLRIEPEKNYAEKAKNILVIARNPGSGNALLPVVKELIRKEEIKITAITDGRAEEIFENNFETQNITPKTMALEADQVFETPNAILMDVSVGEFGLDTYAFATFPEVPKVLVEDYYTVARGFLSKLAERNLSMPEKICVMDQGAKDIIVEKFPNLEERIEITGQPSFDKFAEEDTEKISLEIRKKLGLEPTDKIISYMSTTDEPEKIAQLAEALKKINNNFYFVFRRHPRDNVSYDTFKQIFVSAGIKILDTDQFTTDEIGAASDIILTTWSTEGLNGIYRRKPTVHIVDNSFRVPESLELPLVPVKLGASIGASKMNELVEILPQLMDTGSSLNNSLKEKMEKNYFVDGKNAKRVARVVNNIIG